MFQVHIYIVFETNIGNYNHFDYMEVMFWQDIFVDLEMTGMDEVMFRPPPTPSKFSLKVVMLLNFFFGSLSFV